MPFGLFHSFFFLRGCVEGRDGYIRRFDLVFGVFDALLEFCDALAEVAGDVRQAPASDQHGDDEDDDPLGSAGEDRECKHGIGHGRHPWLSGASLDPRVRAKSKKSGTFLGAESLAEGDGGGEFGEGGAGEGHVQLAGEGDHFGGHGLAVGDEHGRGADDVGRAHGLLGGEGGQQQRAVEIHRQHVAHEIGGDHVEHVGGVVGGRGPEELGPGGGEKVVQVHGGFQVSEDFRRWLKRT